MKTGTIFQIRTALILGCTCALFCCLRQIDDPPLTKRLGYSGKGAIAAQTEKQAVPELFQTTNAIPEVRIVEPQDSGRVAPGMRIPFKLTVSDKEDGESIYDEIDRNRVLLELRHHTGMGKETPEWPEAGELSAVSGIAASNCLNCHSFDGVLIGPSFREISMRYRMQPPDSAEIIDRIRSGASGFWGEQAMPGHPELSKEQIGAMVAWIIKNGSREDASYYKGLEGNLDLHSGGIESGGGRFTLTAWYTDNGEDGVEKRTGKDVVTLFPQN